MITACPLPSSWVFLMRTIRVTSLAILALSLGICAGCAQKTPPPPPDGTSGIRGVCLLAAEPADKDGKVPERKRWPGAIIDVKHTNISSDDPRWNLEFKATADANGNYQLALNPGDYLVFPQDRVRLKDMGISPFIAKVEPGKYTELNIDYDQIKMTTMRVKK